ncbi:MAG: hypothetical protein AAGA85_06605 [Bacteroidota bacterium]
MKNIENEIEETLKSLEGLQRATASDDFRHGVMQRTSFLPQRNPWLNRLRLGIAAMLILGLTNIIALFALTSTTTSPTDLSSEIIEEFYDSTAYFFETTE